ncbi:HAD family hydrolase [Agilicoccus flavus]|uniref:HAD family hydrolase n=1 Tax=Agilicoccus flavus TaxID=2775968 RepID=UPI001CF703CB|nr:HAD-IA family hydrolase [Agilicoccus flavus]
MAGRSVHTVLFDADGLLQHPAAGWAERLSGFDDGDPEGFLVALWEAERPALEGRETLRDSVTRLLASRGLDEGRADEVCALWDNIEVDQEAWQLVRDVADAGVACHLATNQQSYRRDLMIDLGYGDLVEHAFYSCDLGHAKPDPEYFRAILARLDAGPDGVVFVDDRVDNVEAARSVGLDAHVHDPSTGAEGLRGVLRAAGVPGA